MIQINGSVLGEGRRGKGEFVSLMLATFSNFIAASLSWCARTRAGTMREGTSAATKTKSARQSQKQSWRGCMSWISLFFFPRSLLLLSLALCVRIFALSVCVIHVFTDKFCW
jgi:hypothetical protein